MTGIEQRIGDWDENTIRVIDEEEETEDESEESK